MVSRVLAAGIDAAVVVAILGSAYIGIAVTLFLFDPRSFSVHTASIVVSLTAGLIVAICYAAAAWWLTGRTLGGQLLGLRVLTARGHRIRPMVALVRAGLCVIFPLGLFWCAVSPKRLSVQDLVLRTTVRYDWRAKGDWKDVALERTEGSPAPASMPEGTP